MLAKNGGGAASLVESPLFLIFTCFIIVMILDVIYIFSTYNFLFENVMKKINNTNHPKIRYESAIIFYLIAAFGIYFFLIRQNKSLSYSFFLGFFIYLFYEITNYTIIEAWTLQIVAIDSLWGGILFFLTTAAVRAIQRNIEFSYR